MPRNSRAADVTLSPSEPAATHSATPTAGQMALSFAGVSVEVAARRAGVSADYLRRILKNGSASFVLAKRLARICGCGFDVFMFSYSIKSQSKSSKGGANGKRKSRRGITEKRQNGIPGEIVSPGQTAGVDARHKSEQEGI